MGNRRGVDPTLSEVVGEGIAWPLWELVCKDTREEEPILMEAAFKLFFVCRAGRDQVARALPVRHLAG